MRRFTRYFLAFVAIAYVLPLSVAAALWFANERPTSWRQADWSSAGQLPDAHSGDGAEIRVYTARTGRIKGILAVHSWIVVKPEGQARYDRYDVVGWGRPVRRNAYAPDARWYSNEPELLTVITGERASRLVPEVERAIARYPHSQRGDYRIWPGPNSNSFVAYVLDAVPGIGARLPPTAIGKDFPTRGGILERTGDGTGIRLGWNGIVSLTVGAVDGIELNLFGLVAGIDVLRPALKLPGLGRVGFPPATA